MVPWWSLIICFVTGAIVGIVALYAWWYVTYWIANKARKTKRKETQ